MARQLNGAVKIEKTSWRQSDLMMMAFGLITSMCSQNCKRLLKGKMSLLSLYSWQQDPNSYSDVEVGEIWWYKRHLIRPSGAPSLTWFSVKAVLHQEQASSLSSCRREFVSQDTTAGGAEAAATLCLSTLMISWGEIRGGSPTAAAKMYTIRDLSAKIRDWRQNSWRTGVCSAWSGANLKLRWSLWQRFLNPAAKNAPWEMFLPSHVLTF